MCNLLEKPSVEQFGLEEKSSVDRQEHSSIEEDTTENMIIEEMHMEATHSQEPAENSNNVIIIIIGYYYL